MLVVLNELWRNRWKNSQLCRWSFRLLKLSKNILKHLWFFVVFLFQGFEHLQHLRSDLQRSIEVKRFFSTLLLKIAPFCINTFVKFISKAQNIHANIKVFTVSNEQFEVTSHLICIRIWSIFHFRYDFRNVNGVLYLLVVIRKGYWVNGLPEYLRCFLLDQFVYHHEKLLLNRGLSFTHK